MSKLERLVQFELLGQDFSFYTKESEEDMEQILNLLKGIVEQDAPAPTGTVPVAKIAILGCLTLASRYVKLEKEFREYKDNSTERLTQLSEEIVRSLDK